jgi:hypothetical protein
VVLSEGSGLRWLPTAAHVVIGPARPPLYPCEVRVVARAEQFLQAGVVCAMKLGMIIYICETLEHRCIIFQSQYAYLCELSLCGHSGCQNLG